MGGKTVKVEPVEADQSDDFSEFSTCMCGISVHTGAYIVGFLGVLLSGIGFFGSVTNNKYAEAVLEGISALTYLLVFYGRCKKNHHWYLPLLIVHALAIPTFLIVFVLAILVNFKFVHDTDFPVVLHLKFTLEFTKEGLYWTGYNIFTSIINLYLFNVAYRAYMFARQNKKRAKK